MPQCKLPSCPVATNGRCLEGLGLQCPNLLPDAAQAVSVQNVEEIADDDSAYLPTEPLYSGSPLEILEARQFSQRSRTVVVVLVGMRECGKTSLVARIHQEFQVGPIGDFCFAGSQTLPRLEEMNWLAMLESGSSHPQMERSSRQFDNSFLHFTVRSTQPAAKPVDILLNDIAGETFPEMVASESLCNKLHALRRADHLALLIDGSALADHMERHDHIAKAKNFLQRVLQTGQLTKQTILHLITTKQDLLSGAVDPVESNEVVSKLENDISLRFKEHVADLRFWRLAARPGDGTMPTQESIHNLFSTWITQTARYPFGFVEKANYPLPSRDFCRFGS